MILKNLLTLSALTIALASTAQADKKVLLFEQRSPSERLASAWRFHLYRPFINKLEQIPTMKATTPEGQMRCDRFYSRVKQTGKMKIIMGIGYYDFSEGEPFSYAGHDFGMNATIDITYDVMYREILTEKCTGKLQLCGFKETAPGVYSKVVKSPEGKKINATIEIKNPSITPEHAQNVGPLKLEQTAKSDAVTKWFFDGIKTADLVVYNGHSRKGGGPDFHAPRLLENLHVNYAWYAKHTPGLKNLLNALNGPTKPAALLMMSCNSNSLFSNAIRNAAPMMGLATTNAVIPGDIPNKGAIAGMDAFLKFHCEEGFATQMLLEPELREQLNAPRIY